MQLSNHANKKCKDRGISQLAIDLVLEFGSVEHHRGKELLYLDRKGLKRAKRYMGTIGANQMQTLKDIYLVVADDLIVTAARKNTHHKRNRK